MSKVFRKLINKWTKMCGECSAQTDIGYAYCPHCGNKK